MSSTFYAPILQFSALIKPTETLILLVYDIENIMLIGSTEQEVARSEMLSKVIQTGEREDNHHKHSGTPPR